MKKFVSVLLCIVLLFGVVGCTEKPKEKWSEDSEETISVKREDHKIKAAYDDVIARYIQLLSDKREGKELSAPGTIGMDAREVAIAEALYGIVESCRSAEAAEGFGYGYKDVDGNYYISKGTIETAVKLTREVMRRYGISAEHVIRHYDVTKKHCPEPFVRNPALWEDFKKQIAMSSESAAARNLVKAKAGLSDATMDYLSAYRWGEDLIRKLAKAMK